MKICPHWEGNYPQFLCGWCVDENRRLRQTGPIIGNLPVPIYFATSAEHNQKLADGAIRCMEQLLYRKRGHESSHGFCHMLEALLEGVRQLRKDLDQ